jgi:hypothetical protein
MDYRKRYLTLGVLILVCATSQAGVYALDGSGSAQKILADSSWREYVKNIRVNGSAPTASSGGPFTIDAPATGRALVTVPSKVMIDGKPISVLSKLTPAAQATGKLAVALAKVAGPVGVAVAAYDLFQAVQGYNVKYKPEDSSLEVTKVTQTVETEYTISSWGVKWAGTPVAAADLYAAVGYSHLGAGTTVTGCSETHCYFSHPAYGYLGRESFVSRSVPGGKITESSERELMSQIDAAMETGIPSGIVERTIKAGLEAGIPLEIDESLTQLSGPATTSSPKVTTKTNPDGTVETTTDKSNITYQGNNINVTNSSTVTNHNPVTNTTTTSTTTTVNPDLPPETPGLCDLYPDILACQKPVLGELAPVDLKNTTRNLMITKDSGWGPTGGACPAPRTAVIMGKSISMPFTILCDFANMINPILIGFAYLSAALAFLGIGKRD